MNVSRRQKFLISSGIIILLVIVLVFWQRVMVFSQIARCLVVEMNPEKSDVIVVLRGDRNYNRTLEAARLFINGYADYIYISTELVDKSCRKLKEYGVELPSEQVRIRSILIQLGIPEEKILIGQREPGGGTQGEVQRIKAMMLESNFKKAIIVTNWWHTRRTHKFCQKVFDGTGIQVLVVAAKNDKSNPSNWFNYRYEALNVLEEFPKLLIYYFSPSSNLSFNDDPAK